MSWLNLNQSLNSLKGQITNFASEVLSEVPAADSGDNAAEKNTSVTELENKCHNQELEIAALKKLTEELEASLQSERLSRKNGVREDQSSWYWDPMPSDSKDRQNDNQYEIQIRSLQDEISTIKARNTVEMRPDHEGEIKSLREENLNLNSNLEELDKQHQMAMERLLSLKKELQTNFEVLKQEHEDLKNANEDYAIEIKAMLQKLGEKDKEIEHSKADFETLHHKYQNLEKIHSLLRENAEKFQEENQELHEEIFKLQEQVTKLEHEMEVMTKHSELSDVVPRDRYELLLRELNELRGRRHSNRVDLDEINIDDNAKSVIENLKREINEWKHKLSQKELEDSVNMSSMKPNRVQQLYQKYINFELPIDYVGEMPSAADNIAMYKLESVFKTLNLYKKDLDHLKHELSQKNLNINHLQSQIDDLANENDFLTTDLQHYETELSETKKNNDFLISEIATLKNTSKLEPIEESHEDNLVKLETELADSNRINKTFESEITRINKELAEVSHQKVELQKSLNDLKEKYTTMMTEVELFKTQSKAVEELESTTNEEIIKNLKYSTDEIDNLKQRLSNTNAKNEQLSIDIHIIENDKVLLTKEIDDLRNALNEKSSEHKELETLKIALDHTLQDLEVKLDEVIRHKIEIEHEKNKLEEQVMLLHKELSTKNNTLLEAESIVAKGNLTENTQVQETIDRLSKENKALLEAKENVQKTANELKSKLGQQDLLNIEITNLKEEIKKILHRKTELETELSSTDSKIVHLEEEFDKLITDLNEKDSIIDDLNSTIAKNNENIKALSQATSDLENSVTIKSDEVKRLQRTVDELQAAFNDISHKSNLTHDEIERLHKEKVDSSRQLITLTDEISSKNAEISRLTHAVDEKEKMCIEYKDIIESKDKNIKELNQSIVELTDKVKTTDNFTHNDNYAKLVQDKDAVEQELNNLKQNITIKEKEIQELQEKMLILESTCVELNTTIHNSSMEKNELINLITMKHNESIQYHNEIQRLNHVILEQTNEFKKIIEEKERLQNVAENCSTCDSLRVTLKEKDEIIINLNKSVGNDTEIKAELVEANRKIEKLTEECDNLNKTLTIQLDTVKSLKTENLQLSEQEQNSTRELERLRHHLVDMEENYTQELMTSEQKLTECQTRLNQVEERAKQNSTVYTSNSIRANQEVETYKNQIKLLEKQREEAQARLSEADDARRRNEVALVNLQVVLEEFQIDKERDIEAATEKIRNKMEDVRRENQYLLKEIDKLNQKLNESLAGLQAATRLGDQVETKTAQINDLKEQVRTLQISVAAAEERYHSAVSNQQDRVDKNLVKNLVINYVMAANQSAQNKARVLKILSTVLDFNQHECERLGLARSTNTSDGIAAEFVKFLESESKPRPTLPNMMGLVQNVSRSSTPPSRKTSVLAPSPQELGHKRNPSTGSNNLLFQNIESVETSSQISIESDHREPRVVAQLDTGVNQTRNTEGAILKHVLKDM